MYLLSMSGKKYCRRHYFLSSFHETAKLIFTICLKRSSHRSLSLKPGKQPSERSQNRWTLVALLSASVLRARSNVTIKVVNPWWRPTPSPKLVSPYELTSRCIKVMSVWLVIGRYSQWQNFMSNLRLKNLILGEWDSFFCKFCSWFKKS